MVTEQDGGINRCGESLRARQPKMRIASQALAIERQASAQSALVCLGRRVSKPKTRAILGLMRLNFLSVLFQMRTFSAYTPRCVFPDGSTTFRGRSLGSSATIPRIPIRALRYFSGTAFPPMSNEIARNTVLATVPIVLLISMILFLFSGRDEFDAAVIVSYDSCSNLKKNRGRKYAHKVAKMGFIGICEYFFGASRWRDCQI